MGQAASRPHRRGGPADGVAEAPVLTRHIRLLGDPVILDGSGQPQAVRGHQAWALLARVLLARRPLERRTLAAELFAETADPLGAVRWCLAALRKALDRGDCLLGDPVQANLPAEIDVDVLRLDAPDLDVEAAGPLLGTLEPRCSPEFATWLLVERTRLAGQLAARLRRDTLAALASGDNARAVRLAELAVRREPLDEGPHVLLVRALLQAGRPDAASAHVEAAEAAFLAELGQRPSPALRQAARATPAALPGGIAASAWVDSQIRAGVAAITAGAAEAGLDGLRRAAADAERLGDRALLARAALELGSALVHAVRGHDDDGAVRLRQAVELARGEGHAAIAASALRELGYVDALAGRRPAAAAWLAEATAAAADPAEQAGVHGVAGFNLADWGQADAALERYGLALELARTAGHRRREAWTLGIGAKALLAAGRLDEAAAWLDRCLELVDAQGWLAFRPWPATLRAEVELARGAAPSVLRPRVEAIFAAACQLADPCWEGLAARLLARLHAAGGALPEAFAWLGEAHRRSRRHTDVYAALLVEIAASEAEVARRAGDAERAIAAARAWLAEAARRHMDVQVDRAAAFLAGRAPPG
ncbi:MAG: BTAD domain-containing putative transcriptional regulator [Geminicoccaceae bacterium]